MPGVVSVPREPYIVYTTIDNRKAVRDLRTGRDRTKLTVTTISAFSQQRTLMTQIKMPPDNSSAPDRIWRNVHLATLCPGRDVAPDALGIQRRHSIAVRAGRICWIGPDEQVTRALDCDNAEIIDGHGGWITPGLIDSHTHLVYAGQRSGEFEQRQRGVSYSDIAQAGGGILSTVRATRAATDTQLLAAALPRLRSLCAEGVTTVEIKSGYGLSLEDEIKMLRVARQLQQMLPVRIRTTLLAAHTLPPEYRGSPDRSDAYIDLICNEWIPRVAAEGLADAVDVFCEKIAFSTAQCQRVFEAAKSHSLGIKAHVEQLSNQRGAIMASSLGAWSVDHLEYLNDADAAALAGSGTVACLLPGAFYYLHERQLPPLQALRRAAVPIALASDLNPGTSPFASLRLMMNLGCVLLGLTPAEALAGTTRHAAAALGLQGETGQLAVGQAADMLLWDIDHPGQLASELTVTRPLQRIFAGEISHV